MDKCIIFVRVSTERQSYDEQTNRLRYLASMDGYPTENQILIDYKESGIRLKEEERLHRQNILTLRYDHKHGVISDKEFDKKIQNQNYY